MGFLFSGVFWGVVLILIGLSMILKWVFHIDIPVFRIVLGLVIIAFGVQILVGRSFIQAKTEGPGTIVFGEKEFHPRADIKEYSTIFGRSIVDLREPSADLPSSIKISTVFGGTEILVSPRTRAKIRATAVFAGVELPEGNSAAFGETTLELGGSAQEGSSTSTPLDLQIDAVFAGVVVKMMP